ncbi:MAG TPA: tripartite tricarboxylate transporter substrate binding protein [Burkholderiales bacterium]|nr:tripartite tricarboxylate transporter substrate binding protein [Burkholderiales bacterium]
MKKFMAAVLFVAFAVPVCAQAQNYPTKPVRVIVGFSPGGGSDIIGRLIAERLNQAWGQPIIVDNRPGAGGTIAMTLAANAAPDGYTLLMVSGSSLVNAAHVTKVPFDLRKAYAPIAQLTSGSYLFVVHPSVPAHSIKELIALLKARPRQLNFGSSGTGSFAHLGGELFKHLTGTDMIHVPYKGSGAMMIDLIGGQIQVGIPSAISGMPHVRSGKLRALAVTSAKRSPLMPELPTVAEAGVPGFSITSWYGIVAPAGTPASIIGKVNGEVARSIKSPAVVALLAKEGAVPDVGTPEELRALIKDEIDKWGKVIEASNIKFK